MLMEDLMKCAKAPLVTLVLLVAAACTSTENPRTPERIERSAPALELGGKR
jgi:hypothetical protein